MIPAAWVGGLLWIGVGVVVLLAAIVAARLVARFVGEKVRERQMRNDMVVVTRRVVTAVVIVLGLFAALGFAVQSANVTLFGLLIATVVAALGVQQLLQDYVSGYYVLFERHIRIGDRITFDSQSGTGTLQPPMEARVIPRSLFRLRPEPRLPRQLRPRPGPRPPRPGFPLRP